MNVRVLIYMNPLVVDKISKRFLVDKDSGFIYTRQLIISLPTDWLFTILVPKNFDRNFFDSDHVIECVEYDYSTSIHQNRYHFNRNIIANALPYTKDIDVVLNMQPEVSANIRVFFENQRREKPIIINYFHWIDSKLNKQFGNGLDGFIIREVEGIKFSDLTLFHNEYARSLLEESRVMYNLPYENYEYGYFHPLPTIYGETPFDLPNKKIILFNHRLNNTTGWKRVFDICKSLNRDDFVLWFTDEQNLVEKRKLENTPFVIVKSIPFESYGYLLRHSHFTICNTQYATWNMAVLDSINYGTQVITNNTPIMEELGGNIQTDLKESIIRYLDMDKVTVTSKKIVDYNLKSYIENEITNRAKTYNPLKYDKVMGMIKEQGSCTKKEFVNKFWSFHANSNFQKIRWKLISGDCIDDINKTYTEYKI